MTHPFTRSSSVSIGAVWSYPLGTPPVMADTPTGMGGAGEWRVEVVDHLLGHTWTIMELKGMKVNWFFC